MTITTTLNEKKLLSHGWMRGKRKDGGVDWIYPGDWEPRTFKQACEIMRKAYPELYGVAA
jgi:hypothetical protein